ncbi:ketopantoate reductase family protein [Paenisporosarcina sp. TG20]|uniref:ketopantoate reductase family protein n=1 Tax=Paenisporosarcina sp. TG20 TaxID=1211706 RepID=UPI001ED9106B|nr:2-dehydropantoate 2-reductase [Paenisporosarcina sp. TG20]
MVIIGAGAIGLLIGSFLSEQEHEITYITKTTDQAEKLRKHGITRIRLNGKKVITNVLAHANFSLAPVDAIWIVAVKNHQLHNIEEVLHSLPPTTSLLFIQNGLAHIELVNQLNNEHVYLASIEHAAMKQDATTVLHKGIGITRIAPFKTNTGNCLDLSIMQTPSFQIEMVDDAYGVIFRKVVLNACINPLTAILQIKNGELITNKYAFHLMKSLFEEIVLGFPEIKQTITFEDVKKLCVRTAQNNSSMLEDRLNNRKSEIEPIVGALLQLGKTRESDLPLLQSLYHLVLAIDEKGVPYE